MTSLLEFTFLSASLAAIFWLLTQVSQRYKVGIVVTAFSAVMLGGWVQPSLATTIAAVNEDVLSEQQQELQETLKIAPPGNQYQGIEYPQAKGTPLSDRKITEKIRSEVPESLKLSVSNGSVRLSGTVSDRRTAQKIVQNVKEIPGVHEIAYDLGFAG